jgi:CRP/FNR family transcriptional regulator, cyclic AMP receptor protein
LDSEGGNVTVTRHQREDAPSPGRTAPPSFVLDTDQVRAIAAGTASRAYPKNAVILNKGDAADSIYVIASGAVKFFVSDESGKELVLGHAGPGEYFGEVGLDGGARSVSVMTLEPTRINVIPHPDFKAFLSANPDFALHVIRKLAYRIRTLTDNVRNLALLDVYGRVARTLLDLAVERDGRLVVAQKLTHQDIASRVGASREMISRILKDLVAGGYISIEHRIITVNKQLPPRW